MKIIFLFGFLLMISSCAKQFHYSDGEAGRVARYFDIDEKTVTDFYIEQGFSWDLTIHKLLVMTTSPASKEVQEDFRERFEKETEKIKKECLIE